MRTVGRLGLLAESADPAGLAAALAASGLRLAEVVPGAETVLAVAADDATLGPLAELLAHPAPAGSGGGAGGEVVEIEVRYDGADLDDVAAATGMTVDEVVAAHSAATYRGGFSGFAPGFCYLEGLPASLRVGRRSEPRTEVPAGSVAIADRYSAVYPRPSPGGWQLLGTTAARLWDSAREPPALLSPGTTVRFVAR